MDFQGKKMVITGAGPDLGRTLAVCFARLGAELFLSARSRDKAAGTVAICPPNFHNTVPWDEAAWNERRGFGEGAADYLTARNVFECVRFALSQDRICSVDQIIMSNNHRGSGD